MHLGIIEFAFRIIYVAVNLITQITLHKYGGWNMDFNPLSNPHIYYAFGSLQNPCGGTSSALLNLLDIF